MKWKHWSAAAVAVALIQVGGASAASADSGSSNVDSAWIDAFDCALEHGFNCWNAEDARRWAGGVTAWKFPEHRAHNDAADAFRHCAWVGAMATRLGENGAYYVGFVHERNAKHQPDDEMQMDLWNNFMGAGIGAEAVRIDVSDQWGYVLDNCESLARQGELFGLGGVRGGY